MIHGSDGLLHMAGVWSAASINKLNCLAITQQASVELNGALERARRAEDELSNLQEINSVSQSSYLSTFHGLNIRMIFFSLLSCFSRSPPRHTRAAPSTRTDHQNIKA